MLFTILITALLSLSKLSGGMLEKLLTGEYSDFLSDPNKDNLDILEDGFLGVLTPLLWGDSPVYKPIEALKRPDVLGWGLPNFIPLGREAAGGVFSASLRRTENDLPCERFPASSYERLWPRGEDMIGIDRGRDANVRLSPEKFKFRVRNITAIHDFKFLHFILLISVFGVGGGGLGNSI